jgi:hypothetical protein
MPTTTTARRTLLKYLVDECVIREAHTKAQGVLGADHEVTYPAAPTETYIGKCLVSDLASSHGTTPGEAPTQLDETGLKLPPDTPGLAPGQIVTITASNDPTLVDTEFEIVRVAGRTHRHLRRVTMRARTAFPTTGAP